MSEEKNRAAVLGCLAIAVQVPLAAVLMVGVLAACEAPTWVWVVFWIYYPVLFVLGIFRALVEVAAK